MDIFSDSFYGLFLQLQSFYLRASFHRSVCDYDSWRQRYQLRGSGRSILLRSIPRLAGQAQRTLLVTQTTRLSRVCCS